MRPSPLLALFLFALAAGWICGFDVGAMAFGLKQWPGCLQADDEAVGAILVAAAGGGLVAALASGWLADAVGRRWTVLAGGLALAAGIGLVATARGWPMVAAGRALEGAAGSLLAAGATMLLAESAPTRWRGMTTALFPLVVWAATVAGTGAAAWTEAQVAAKVAAVGGGSRSDAARALADGAWRALFIASLPPVALLFASGAFVLESPRWKFDKGRREEARAILSRLRPPSEADLVWREMEGLAAVHAAGKGTGAGWAVVQRPEVRRPLLRVLALFALQGATGMAAVLYFPTQLLEGAGWSADTAGAGAVGLTLVFLVAAVVNACLVDRLGRRVLVRLGLLLAVAGLGMATLAYWRMSAPGSGGSVRDGTWLFACFSLYAFGLGIGPSGCLWLLAAELLPARVRSAGLGLGVVLLNGASTACVVAFMPMARTLGLHAALVPWLAGSAVFLVFAAKGLPETKGRTLEEIEAGE